MNATTLQKSHDRVPVCERHDGVSDAVFIFTIFACLMLGFWVGRAH